MVRKTIRCNKCSHNPNRLFDLIMEEDGHVYAETKCKRDGIVKVDITKDFQRLFMYWQSRNQKIA